MLRKKLIQFDAFRFSLCCSFRSALRSVFNSASVLSFPGVLVSALVFASLFFTTSIFAGCASSPNGVAVYKKQKIQGETIEFSEVWGWVMQERESSYSPEFPITDIGYFAASVGTYGELTDIPQKEKLGPTDARVHLVVVCEGRALTHFVLDSSFKLTDKLIEDILKAGADFDGIQIDFENIPARDNKNFYTFIEKLSKKTHENGKMFTICVPARTRTLNEDAFPYEQISKIADRIMVMAYDEHWSTSVPGPIASFDWCDRVSTYAASVVPQEKLVMGLPFYGRSWEDENLARARSFQYTNEFLAERKATNVKYTNSIPNVEFTTKQKVFYWFEDSFSSVEKMRLYKSKEIDKVAFWRIGLEDLDVWNWLSINEIPEN